MVNVFAIAFLCSDDNVLLLHRKEVSFGSGLYGMSGGKVKQGETARQAVKHEVAEELGLDIAESDFELVHTFHRKGTETEFVALVFKADISKMSSCNNEPRKHDEIKLFNVQSGLPANIIPAHKQAIECINQAVNYSEHGW